MNSPATASSTSARVASPLLSPYLAWSGRGKKKGRRPSADAALRGQAGLT
jgi:hypothetical protein